MDDLDKIKKLVKSDHSVVNGDVDRAIELTYREVSEQWVKRLKVLSK